MTDLPPIPAPIFQTRPSRNRQPTPTHPNHSTANTTTSEDDPTNTTPLTAAEAQAKIGHFQHFIANKLKPDLTRLLTTRDTLYTTTTHYIQLRTNLTHLLTQHTTHFTARTNVGCDFYVRAEVASTELVTVDVGLGFHVELTLGEAVVVCEEREAFLQARAQVLTDRASVISAHIKLVYEGIGELMKVQEGVGKRRSSGGTNFYG